MLDPNQENYQDVWHSAIRTVFSDTLRYESEYIDPAPGGFFLIQRRVRVPLDQYFFYDLRAGDFVTLPDTYTSQELIDILTRCFIQPKTAQPLWLMPDYVWGWKWVAHKHQFVRATRHGATLVYD